MENTLASVSGFDTAADHAIRRGEEHAMRVLAEGGTDEEAAEAFATYILAYGDELRSVVTAKLYPEEG